MSKKSLALSFLTVFSLPLATAQISGGGNIQGILPLISEVLGIDVGNPYNVLGILATLGIMNVSVYIILKVGAKKLDIQDTVLPGRDEGRNILAIMSTLVTLSIFGTGAAAGLIAGFQSMFLLGFTFLLIGAGVFIIIGGTGGILGGGSYVAGKSAKATTEGIREGAQAMEQANEILETAEREESEGRERGNNGDRETEHDEEADAEQKLNRVLQILDHVEEDFQDVLEEDKKRIKAAIRNIGRAEKEEETEEKAEEDVEKRILRADHWAREANNVIEGAGAVQEDQLLSGRGPYMVDGLDYSGAYGLEDMHDDLENVEKRISLIVSNINEEEGNLGEGFKELLEAAQEVVKLHSYVYELKELLKEAEDDTDFMEKLSKEEKFKDLYSDARDADKYEEEDLEPKLERLEEEEEELFNQLQKADDLFEKHLRLNKNTIQTLEMKVSKEEPSILGSWKELNKEVNDLLAHATDHSANRALDILAGSGSAPDEGTILYYLEDIGEHLKNIDSELNSEYKKEQEEIQELENYLKNF